MNQSLLNLSRRAILLFILLSLHVYFSYSQEETDPDPANKKDHSYIHSDSLINTGYFRLSQQETTGAITRITYNDFNNGNINDPMQLVQGKVAGLDISKPGSDPNGSFYLRLRGLNTINANTQPLVVIDGVPDGTLLNVDPADIESITVLRDAASAAIYGVRGSNGVIIVETKKETAGVTHAEYNVYTSVEKVARNLPALSVGDWRILSAETGLGTDFGQSTNWFDQIEQTALSQSHNLSLSGGSDKTLYRASINYRNGEGVQINTGYSQMNGRIYITQKAINDKLQLDLTMAATERESEYGFSSAFKYAGIYNPTAPVRTDDPSYSLYDGYFQQVLFDYYNPVSILELNKNSGRNRLTNLSLKGAYKITKGLVIDAFYSIQTTENLAGTYYDRNDFWTGIWRNGLASRSFDLTHCDLFESTLRYNGKLGASLDMKVTGGYSYQDFTNEGFSARGGDFITDDFTFNNLAASQDFKNGRGSVNSYKNSNKLIAFFGVIDLNFNDLLFFNVTSRYDGSSRLGSDKKWGLYTGFGAGVNLTGLIDVDCIDNMKLRMNYGITGNQPVSSYLSLFRLGEQGQFFYNGIFYPGYTKVSAGNPDLRSEKKREFDIGIDFSLKGARFTGSVDLYSGTSYDLLYQYYINVPPALSNFIWLNTGEIKSSGLELTLSCMIIKHDDFSYRLGITHSTNLSNKLSSISGTYNGISLTYGIQDLGNLNSPGSSGPGLVRSQEGAPIGQLIAWRFKEIDQYGYLALVDVNGDGYIDSRDITVAGNGLPKHILGIDNNFKYRRLDLNVFLRGVFGHDLNNTYRSSYESPALISSYNVPSSSTTLRNASGALMRSYPIMTDRDIEDASFIALDNICVGYNFSLHETSAFKKIRFYVSANNLFYLTGYKGSDPNPRYEDSEVNGGTFRNPLVPGIDRTSTWPRTRSFTVGANIVF